MRSYGSLSAEDKEKMYSLARAGVSDSVLCDKYKISEDMLLRVFDEMLVTLQRRRGYKIAEASKCNAFGCDDIEHDCVIDALRSCGFEWPQGVGFIRVDATDSMLFLWVAEREITVNSSEFHSGWRALKMYNNVVVRGVVSVVIKSKEYEVM